MANEGGGGMGRFFTLLLILLLAALLGSLLGELLGILFPSGMMHDLCVKGYPVGFNTPLTVDLRVMTFTFGFTLRLNLFSFAGILIGLVFFRK